MFGPVSIDKHILPARWGEGSLCLHGARAIGLYVRREKYYSDVVYARLLALKKVVDPGLVFCNPQAVGA